MRAASEEHDRSAQKRPLRPQAPPARGRWTTATLRHVPCRRCASVYAVQRRVPQRISHIEPSGQRDVKSP